MTLLGFENHILTGTLAGATDTDYALDNLMTRIGADRWVPGVDVAGGAYFTLDTGSATSKWGAVGLFQTNFTSACEMVVKLGTTLNGDDVYSGSAVSGAVAGRNYLIDLLDQEYTARYLRVELTDTDNPDLDIQVGLAYAGPLVKTTVGMSYDSALGLEVSTSETRTIGGQEYPIFNYSQFIWDLSFDALKNAEVDDLALKLSRYAQAGENVLMIPFNDGTRLMSQAVYGRPKNGVHIKSRAFDLNTWTFSIADRL